MIENSISTREPQSAAAARAQLNQAERGEREVGERAHQAEEQAQELLNEFEAAIMRVPLHEWATTQERDIRADAHERGAPQPRTPTSPKTPRRKQELRETESPIKTATRPRRRIRRQTAASTPCSSQCFRRRRHRAICNTRTSRFAWQKKQGHRWMNITTRKANTWSATFMTTTAMTRTKLSQNREKKQTHINKLKNWSHL